MPDLAGGTDQVGIIQLRRDMVFVGLGEEPAKTQRLFEKCQGDIERPLPLFNPKQNLPATLTRPDVIMASHAEGIEAECLLPLARDGDQDRGPFDSSGCRPSRLGLNITCRCGPASTRCHPTPSSGIVCCIRCGCGCSDISKAPLRIRRCVCA